MSTTLPLDVPSLRLRPRRSSARRASRSRLVKWASAAVYLAFAVWMVVDNATYRALEAAGAALTLTPVIDGQVTYGLDRFWITSGDFVQGFRVTAECTGAILVAPLLLLAAVLMVFTRATPIRVWVGTLAMIATVTVVNEVRLALIGWSSMTWGMDRGYPVSHTLVGSVIGIIGFALGLTALVLISVRKRRRR